MNLNVCLPIRPRENGDAGFIMEADPSGVGSAAAGAAMAAPLSVFEFTFTSMILVH